MLVIVLVLGAVAALLVANGGLGGPGASPAPPSSVEGVIPANAGVVAEGRAVPAQRAEVAPASAGRVASIPVTVGDVVAEGDVVLQLDDEAAALDVESAVAAYKSATATTARAENASAQARAQVDQARAGIDQAQASRRAADAARDALPSGASRAQERQADAQVDQAAAGVEVARAQLAAARASLRVAESAAQAAFSDEIRAKAAVASAELSRASMALKSPIAGTVISIEPAIGDLIQPGNVTVRVADLGGWRFETSDLSETSVARVREGAVATITVDGLPGEEISGTVESVGAYGAASQGDIVFRVVVAPSGAVPEELRWNMTVTIEIEGVPAGS